MASTHDPSPSHGDSSGKTSQQESDAAEQLRRDRDSLRRALRDLEGAEARVKRNAERVYQDARSSLVLELLPVLDDLDRSIEAADARADPALLQAVHMSRRRLDQILARYGAERIDANGERFDPSLHDAVTTVRVSDPEQNMTVLRQLAPGYRFGDRLLRPARVVVGIFPS